MRPRPKMLGAKTAVTIHDFSAQLGTGEETTPERLVREVAVLV